MNAVVHNSAAHRFEVTAEGQLAVCDYQLEADRMVLTHTFVPSALRGRGLAEQLVRAALAEAERTGRRVVPACSYVAAFIERHPEFRRLVAD